jgi:hypothetical protein
VFRLATRYLPEFRSQTRESEITSRHGIDRGPLSRSPTLGRCIAGSHRSLGSRETFRQTRQMAVADRAWPYQQFVRSRDFEALETAATDQDFLVEQRGFEPPTSSICTIFESSTKRSFIFSLAGVRERVAPARTALRGSERMPPSILAPSSSVVGSARQSFRRGVPARAQAQRFRVRGKIDWSLIWSSSIGRS